MQHCSIDTEKLEKLLIANWTAFLQPREILKFVIEQAKTVNIDSPISNLSISRFELNDYGFLVWIEFNSIVNNQKINGTIEATIDSTGNLHPIDVAI
jgi:hypothetical protein